MDDQPILILANNKGNAWDFAVRIYNKLNNDPDRDHKYHLARVEVTKFADGELFVRVLDNVRAKRCFFIHDSSESPQDWLVSLSFINDALFRSSAAEVNNIIPYLKYSRQDRMADPRTPISSSVVARIIRQNAHRVLTCDLHNPATTGSYTLPFDNLRAYPVIIEHLKKNYASFLENAVIVSPDVGSAKRAESYAKILGLDVAIAHKKRAKSNEISEMTIIGDVYNKNVLIVDDMIDTGGTLCKAAEILKEKGARQVFACATHGLFSKDAYEKLNKSVFDKVIVTDSIPREPNGKIEVIDISPLFAEAINRITHGGSVSELFD